MKIILFMILAILAICLAGCTTELGRIEAISTMPIDGLEPVTKDAVTKEIESDLTYTMPIGILAGSVAGTAGAQNADAVTDVTYTYEMGWTTHIVKMTAKPCILKANKGVGE